ncbi:PAS domain-containing protein [Actinokineospora enzanensis]|uniref:PAS domain-containing protein n=1 Tax=Actinokineospora enzanensis TaxID=155975 RepID=UPI00036E8CB8|nr:PAS domain-containing protein [Actinokineospora enzanensis]
MRQASVRPTGVERRFGADELIVTKTDLKGVITYANDVFLRVSEFHEDEVIGKPHNVIRHPMMPRTLFKLLWDTIQARREIFAYAMNMASNGDHYWVLAHATPSFDGAGRVVGYHSSRRLPTPSAVATVKQIYDRIRTAEQAATSTSAAIAAGTEALNRELAAHGQSYDEYFWSITPGSTR